MTGEHGVRGLPPILESRHGRWLLKLLCAIRAYSSGAQSQGTSGPPDNTTDRVMDGTDAANLSAAFCLSSCAADSDTSCNQGRQTTAASTDCPPEATTTSVDCSQGGCCSAHEMAAMVSHWWSVERLEALGKQPHSVVKRELHQQWAELAGRMGNDDGVDGRCPIHGLAAHLTRASLLPAGQDTAKAAPLHQPLQQQPASPTETVCCPQGTVIGCPGSVAVSSVAMLALSVNAAAQWYQHAVKALRSDGLPTVPPGGMLRATACDDQGEARAEHEEEAACDEGWVKLNALVDHWASAAAKQQPKKKKKATPVASTDQIQDTASVACDVRAMARAIQVCDLFLRLQWHVAAEPVDEATGDGGSALRLLLRATYLHKTARTQAGVRSSLRTLTRAEKQKVWSHLHTTTTTTAGDVPNSGFYDVTLKMNAAQAVQTLRRDGGRVCPPFRPFLLCCPGAYLASRTTRRLHRVHVVADDGEGGDDSCDDCDGMEDGAAHRSCEGVDELLWPMSSEGEAFRAATSAPLIEAMKAVNDLQPGLVFPAFNNAALEVLWATHNVVQLTRTSSPLLSSDASSADAGTILSSSIFLVMMEEPLPGAAHADAAVAGTLHPTTSANVGRTIPLHMLLPSAPQLVAPHSEGMVATAGGLELDDGRLVPLYSGHCLRVSSSEAHRVVLTFDGDALADLTTQRPSHDHADDDPSATTTRSDPRHDGKAAPITDNPDGDAPAGCDTKAVCDAGAVAIDYDLCQVRNLIESWRQSQCAAVDVGSNRNAESRYMVLHLPIHPREIPPAAVVQGSGGTKRCDGAGGQDAPRAAATYFFNRRSAISALRRWLEEACGLHVFSYAPMPSDNRQAAAVAPADRYVSDIVAASSSNGASAQNLVVLGCAGLPARWCAAVGGVVCGDDVSFETTSWVVVQLPDAGATLRDCIALPFERSWGSLMADSTIAGNTADQALRTKLMARAVRALQPARNDRLEFLGDAVVDYALVRRFLFGDDEGDCRRDGSDAPRSVFTAASVVSTASELGERMAQWSGNLHLGSVCLPPPLRHYMIVAHRCAPQSKVLADAFEALMGAVFLHAVVDRGASWSRAVRMVEGFVLGGHM